MTTLFQNKRLQLLIIIATAILLNINTLHHEYALDDEMVIKKNMLVQKGFSGIIEILRTDAYKSYFTYAGADTLALTGGRYRPLSIVSFAIEQQLFGETLGQEYLDNREQLQQMEQTGANPKQIEALVNETIALNKQIDQNTLALAPVRHAFQIIFYALCCAAFFWLLQVVWKKNAWLPFLAALLFTVHPVHTEVVANIKSRDEIFSLLFIFLTCMFFIRYFDEPKRKKWLLWGSVFYLLAFLSKEYAFALIVIIPVYYYIHHSEKLLGIIKKGWFISLVLCSIVFALIRHTITAGPVAPVTEVLNDPYLYAEPHQVLPSKIAVWIEYLRILLFPFRLSSDYSYSTIHYTEFSTPTTLISLFAWLVILAATGYTVWKRKSIAFAWLWLVAFFFMINNFFIPLGATMGERLIFHSSAGFCMLAIYYSGKLLSRIENINVRKLISFTLLFIVMGPFAYATVGRNLDWKNDYTLFTKDVITVPKSAMANSNAGAQYFEHAMEKFDGRQMTNADSLSILPEIKKSLHYSSQAVQIHPRHITSYINRALAYFHLNQLDSAIADWKMASQLYQKRHPALVRQAIFLMNMGLNFGAQKNFAAAIKVLEPASIIDPYNPVIWNNLGGAYFMHGDMEKATRAFETALRINPNLQDARNGYNAAKQQLGH